MMRGGYVSSLQKMTIKDLRLKNAVDGLLSSFKIWAYLKLKSRVQYLLNSTSSISASMDLVLVKISWCNIMQKCDESYLILSLSTNWRRSLSVYGEYQWRKNLKNSVLVGFLSFFQIYTLISRSWRSCAQNFVCCRCTQGVSSLDEKLC